MPTEHEKAFNRGYILGVDHGLAHPSPSVKPSIECAFKELSEEDRNLRADAKQRIDRAIDRKTLTARIKLASVIVHLDEYADTKHPIDLQAARALLDDPEVKAELDDLERDGFLPLRRDGKRYGFEITFPEHTS